MIKISNECNGCSCECYCCKLKRVNIEVCDLCQADITGEIPIKLDGGVICRECAQTALQEIFDDMTNYEIQNFLIENNYEIIL